MPKINEPIGADLFNQSVTGTVAMTMSNRATDSHHIPCVLEPIGFDSYNLAMTGNVGRCLSTSSGGLNEHIPLIVEAAIRDDITVKYDLRGVGYTLSDRDYKGVQCVVIKDAESNGNT